MISFEQKLSKRIYIEEQIEKKNESFVEKSDYDYCYNQGSGVIAFATFFCYAYIHC